MTIWFIVSLPAWLASGVCAGLGFVGMMFVPREISKGGKGEASKLLVGAILFLIAASLFGALAAYLGGY